MANLNSNAAIKFTWSQLLNLYGDYLVYDHTDDYNDDIEVYDHTDDYNDDIEAYDHTDDYNDDIEAYNDTDDYNDDTEFYNDTDDDNDDTEVNDTDDDNYNDDDYNNYILDDDDDYNDYILDGGGNEVPILPEKKNPSTLYRVHYSESVTQYSHEGGFLANNQYSLGPVKLEEFHSHLNWRSRTPSRFISTFSDRSHAFAWARNWQQKHPYGWYFIMTIKPHRTDKIYHMETVIECSGVGIPSDCPLQRTQPDEYLFFRQIPEDRIVELFDPDMEDPLESWSSAHELSVAPYRRVEESARAERDIYSGKPLLILRSIGFSS
ncbi:hypothetical protein TWF788_005223 [Orbilia oligospora]|uniref:DUF7587 domain-containing protein n=1 Tax=Orbilia oligospora TaxID=2813651 RepID=A0A7C8TXG9_ORBOL|nr:hypothetical protein TWF788_005223 [Orbilia oligospora]